MVRVGTTIFAGLLLERFAATAARCRILQAALAFHAEETVTMRPRAMPLLEQTIEDWLRGYLLNRVNKYVNRIEWVKQDTVDGPTMFVSNEHVERHIREIASEAADHIMVGICEAFTFTDDEAVVPSDVEPEAPGNHPAVPDSSPVAGVA